MRKHIPAPLTFRCSNNEAIELAEAARIKGISRGSLIRRAALAAAADAIAQR
jgi:uncharacterized protein (DUF1778 family)